MTVSCEHPMTVPSMSVADRFYTWSVHVRTGEDLGLCRTGGIPSQSSLDGSLALVVPYDSRLPTQPPIVALPLQHLAASATGSASALYPKGGAMSETCATELRLLKTIARLGVKAMHRTPPCLALWERWHGAAVTERVSEAGYWQDVEALRRTPPLSLKRSEATKNLE